MENKNLSEDKEMLSQMKAAHGAAMHSRIASSRDCCYVAEYAPGY